MEKNPQQKEETRRNVRDSAIFSAVALGCLGISVWDAGSGQTHVALGDLTAATIATTGATHRALKAIFKF
jgi:hypothetical protein